MEFIKKNYKYLLFFLLIFVALILFGSNNTDNIWNYGMAHAIRSGEVPYNDFNIITTPLYAFMMSSFLFFYDSYVVFLLEQALLCTILFYFVEKLIPDKIRIFVFFMFFPIFYFIFPNYNFLVFLLLVIIIYLEEKKANDYLIGIVLGLLILSKHTVGGVVFLCSLISTHNFKRIGKRSLTTFVVLLFYLIYLLVSKSLMSFLDLGIFGLFDFGGNNNYYSLFCIIGATLIFIYMVFYFIKDKSYLNYYLLGSFAFIIPINDMFHFVYLFVFFVLIILIKHKIFCSMNFVFSFLILLPFLLNSFINFNLFYNIDFLDVSYFKFYVVSKERKKYIENILKKYQSYDNAYMLSLTSMFFDIASNHEITYFDVPLYGNFGYDGTNKMKEKIKEMHDTYFFIEDNDDRQYVNLLNDYVRKLGKKAGSVEFMEIYYIE